MQHIIDHNSLRIFFLASQQVLCKAEKTALIKFSQAAWNLELSYSSSSSSYILFLPKVEFQRIGLTEEYRKKSSREKVVEWGEYKKRHCHSTVGLKILKSPGAKMSWNQINQFHKFFFTKINFWNGEKVFKLPKIQFREK